MDVIKANRKYVGQICKICKREIELGDTIHICPNCQSVNHEDCWQNEGGCNSLSCNSLQSKSSFQNNNLNYQNNYQNTSFSNPNNFQNPSRPNQNNFQNNSRSFSNVTSPNMVPCRWCKEPIPRGSRKCHHCGEYQNDADRKASITNTVPEEDTSIPGGLWASIVIFPDIALIAGIVYICRGQGTRGLKIIGASIVALIIKIFIIVISKSN